MVSRKDYPASAAQPPHLAARFTSSVLRAQRTPPGTGNTMETLACSDTSPAAPLVARNLRRDLVCRHLGGTVSPSATVRLHAMQCAGKGCKRSQSTYTSQPASRPYHFLASFPPLSVGWLKATSSLPTVMP
jgi:hypothetical protein